jgi:hypothetical protein
LSTHSSWKPPSSATELGGDRAGGEAMAPAAASWGGRNERGRGLGRARVGVKAAAGGQGQDRQVAARFQRGTGPYGDMACHIGENGTFGWS